MGRNPKTFDDAKRDDAKLVRAVLGGDSKAFDNLVERYFGMAYAIALAHLAHREMAEDLAQEVFIRAYLYLGNLKNPHHFSGWITRIARNLAIDWQRRRQHASKIVRMVQVEDFDHIPAPSKMPEAHEKMVEKERKDTVEKAILSLSPDLRELVLLHFMEEMSKKEIAQRLGVHPATVGRKISRALENLKSSLEPILRETAPKLRAPKKATARTIAVIAGVAAMSGTAQAAMITVAKTGFIAGVAKLPYLLKSFFAISATGGKIMGMGKGIAIIATVAVVGGGVYYHYATQTEQDVNPRSNIAETSNKEPSTEPAKKEEGEITIDLSTPEAAISSFTKAAVLGNVDLAQSCFSPTSHDYEDVKETLTSINPMKNLFASIDPNVPVKIISQEQTDQGLTIVWQVTFGREFTVKGMTFKPGDTFDLDATLIKSGDQWLFWGF